VSEPQLETVLAQCTEAVLEQMFFVRALNGPLPAPDSVLIVEVPFEGDPCGRLALRVTAPAARSIAADFLGEEECVLSEQQVGEVMCELANIICGSVLSRVESDTTFRLGSSRLTSDSEVFHSENAALHSVALDNGAILIAFDVERPVCPLGG